MEARRATERGARRGGGLGRYRTAPRMMRTNENEREERRQKR
jgi:hypothetical protein